MAKAGVSPLGARDSGPHRIAAGRSPAVPGKRAFTLVELIVVMVLLLIVASMVAPRMSSFFRGRALSSEARRMLSLINYAQSRAVATGAPQGSPDELARLQRELDEFSA